MGIYNKPTEHKVGDLVYSMGRERLGVIIKINDNSMNPYEIEWDTGLVLEYNEYGVSFLKMAMQQCLTK